MPNTQTADIHTDEVVLTPLASSRLSEVGEAPSVVCPDPLAFSRKDMFLMGLVGTITSVSLISAQQPEPAGPLTWDVATPRLAAHGVRRAISLQEARRISLGIVADLDRAYTAANATEAAVEAVWEA